MNVLTAFLTFCMLTTPTLVYGANKNQITDNHPNCQMWAEAGECDANPNYMRVECKKSCERIDKSTKGGDIREEIAHIKSFYDLSARDIDNKEFQFGVLEDKVTVIVNVASYCGYTESHYKGLVELYDTFKDTNRFELLAFPSNQFGEQEPDSCPMIKKFAAKKGVEFRMMYKIDVNGRDAHIVYKYLKAKAGPTNIHWNFATYFVVAPGGMIRSYSGVEPMELKELTEGLLSEEL